MTVWTGPFSAPKAHELVDRVIDRPLAVRTAFVERVLRLASEASMPRERTDFADEVVACATIVAASLPRGYYLAAWGADVLPAAAPALTPLAYHTLVRVAGANGTWSRCAAAGPADHLRATVGNVAQILATAMMPGLQQRRTLERCAGAVELFETLSGLRPRDCDFRIYEIDSATVAGPVLDRLSVTQRLLAGVAAAPILAGAVEAAMAADPWALRLVGYLKCDFPPERAVPVLESGWLTPLEELAQGPPGRPVECGVFPSTIIKLARLALARNGCYPAATVIDAAEHAYDPGRAYQAHDALACALVCPDVDATPLVDRYVWNPVHRPGRRARRKRNRLVAWAVADGYLVPGEAAWREVWPGHRRERTGMAHTHADRPDDAPERRAETSGDPAEVSTTIPVREPSTGAAGTDSGRAVAGGDPPAAAGTAAAAETQGGYGQVLGRGIKINRDAAEAGPGSPQTGARYDEQGNAVA